MGTFGFLFLWQVGDVLFFAHFFLVFASRKSPFTYCIVFVRFLYVVKWNIQCITLNHCRKQKQSTAILLG